jgi:hypothetical protein
MDRGEAAATMDALEDSYPVSPTLMLLLSLVLSGLLFYMALDIV